MSSKTSLAILRAHRGNLKGSLTRLASFSEKITENVKLEALQVRIEKLDELWSKLSTSQEQIYEFAEEESYVDPEPEFEDFESKYLMVKSVLLSAIRERTVVAIKNNDQSISQSSVTQQMNTSVSPQVITDFLPKIHIEPFSGNYRDWPAFRDMYTSSVHSKVNLSPTQKFNFLRSCLRGEALTLLTHIPVSDATYGQAWERLENRYDRPRYIVNSLLETFMHLPSIQSSNVRILRKISDGADEVIRGLNSLNSLHRDPWMIYTLVSKVDPDTRQAWAADSVDTECPTIDQFLTFLERRCEALESSRGPIRESNRSKPTPVYTMHASSTIRCPKCNGSHLLPQCPEFRAMDLEAKRDFVKSNRLCFNCLRTGHNSVHCQSKFRCKTCHSRHHSLVHPNVNNSSPHITANVQSIPSSPNHFVTNHSVNIVQYLPQILLPTAIGKVIDRNGVYQPVRMLIDSGSQVSFITESCVQRLGLRRTNARIPISGIGATNAGKSRGLVSLVIGSFHNPATILVDMYILSTITSTLPAIPFDFKDMNPISTMDLADPSFNQPSPIDILLGADKVWDILQGAVVKSDQGQLIAQKTIFGWVLAGRLLTSAEQNIQSHHTVLDIDSILQAFWNIEELDSKSILSEEEKAIENHFSQTHRRHNDGKYIVKLPFKFPPTFENTLSGARSRLTAMERKFARDASLFHTYAKFMDEYLALGHMSKVPSSEILKSNSFYLPHHAVLKPDSPTTKLRVVFDGSYKDTQGNSLNELLMVGPPIQRNLFSVSLRFRRHKYVFTADIIKMFRQIWIADEDCDYQRIVWRKSPNSPIEHFRLHTVTYGTSCAPYLSVRVLEQLALDHRNEYPVASEILLNDFYVDDVVSGGDSLADAIYKKQRLVELLKRGGFELSKWQSNCKELLPENEQIQSESIPIDSEADSWVKVLGLYWNSKLDCFSYRLNLTHDEPITKRHILRDVARIFDPLGFLAPSIVQLKIIFQDLWHRQLNWDDQLPDSIIAQWRKIRQELSLLTDINIPRSIGISNTTFQLHGFSDASASAYAAVIYSRCMLPNGVITTNIVAAKSRVAPIKQLSIPRLELCGALLLARLLAAVQKSLNTTFCNVYAWCDSQVVLSWLSSPPRRWGIFVGNRTSEILTTIPRNRWFHIRSDENPADCASRGINPSSLVQHPIWWTGPHWLVKSEDSWPIVHNFEEHPLSKQEEKKQPPKSYVMVQSEHPFDLLSSRISSWNRLVRSTAFMLRFISKCRKQSKATSHLPCPQEIYSAKDELIKWVQHLYFEKDIQYYVKHGRFPKLSKISNLTPFLDEKQVLRVGGRIQDANISYNAKHPIILPKGHVITRLIAIDLHQRLLHPGISTLFVLIRQEYWIIGGRNLLRKITHECIKCFRQRKMTSTQIMGNLPPQRIQCSRPFTHCGCDYAGPFSIKTKMGRKIHITKGYVSLFVCLATKAIHLELVSNLTTEAFLAALRRFVARRGKPSHMYSDNGTNFRGSARILSEMHKITLSEHHNTLVAESLARDAITWHFIPPSAPHFGGLWEAGVKSVKQHLRRVIQLDVLSFEEFSTPLTQIEALLNSRPICHAFDNDLDALTPAHFILGESYSAVPEPSTEIPQNKRSCWQTLQTKIQGFWKRWSMEYLTSLQQRPRWSQSERNIAVDDLVVIKDPNLPPGKWAIGRVIEVHPGKDGHVRVVTLRTAAGNFTRPIHKLALLPIR